MSDNDDAIEAYREAVENLPQAKAEDAGLKVLEALLARDRVARELAQAPTPGALATVAEIDRALKAKAEKINEIVGTAKLTDWREARQQPAASSAGQVEGWWWSLDSRAAREGLHLRALNYLLWGCIVVSLSFVVEGLRRFLSGEVGVFGTVLQGLVTLLVGSTLIELAKQVAAVRSGQSEGKKFPPLKGRLIFTIAFMFIAFVMWFLLPQVVKYYSNRGVSERYEGQLSNPIGHYQRTVSLDPSDAISHYNLARAYEVISEYDKAESEYKSAIRWDDDLVSAYDGLGRLLIARKKEYADALRLLDAGLGKLEAQKQANQYQNEDNYKRIKVSLLKNHAWAYFGLKYYTQAEDDLGAAIDLRPQAAAPYCLLGQVLDEMAKPENGTPKRSAEEVKKVNDKVKIAYQKCVAFSHNQADKIEPDWMALAQERINQEDEKKPAATKQNEAPRRQSKKP
jgi:tetratricopeptide (TPR) repeat protein